MSAPASAWLPSAAELRLFSPELVLIGTIVALLLVPLLAGRRAQVTALVAWAGCLIGLLATNWVAPTICTAAYGGLVPAQDPPLPPMLIADRFTLFYKLLLFTFLLVVIGLWSVGREQEEGKHNLLRSGTASASAGSGNRTPPLHRGGTEFLVLLLTSALGMMLMVGTLNLLVIVVAIETASLPSYAIVASDRRSRLGAEAALKYVMFGAASAAIMVYGVSLLYGRFGTLDLAAIAGHIAKAPFAADAVFWLALLAVGVGIAFKIAAVPMHLWCPDVFEGAPIEVTTWLSVASKAAGLGLLLRIVNVFSATPALTDAVAPLSWGIGVLAAITCTVGNLAALRQESVKRILAYSSIAHAGYMLMAAAILVPPLRSAGHPSPASNAGMAAIIAYLLVYMTMNAGAFGATALVAWQTGSDHLSAFTGLGRRAPWVALPMAVCLFSLVGLPPLGGFAAKWYLLIGLGRTAMQDSQQAWLWVLVIVAVVNTAISLYYYVRIVRQMYLTDDPEQPAFAAPLGGLALVNACAIVLLLLGTIWFNPLGQRAALLSSGIFRPAGVPPARVFDAPPVPAQVAAGASPAVAAR
jgi:NADH-quinone oxidoreductase subunit N